MYSGHHETNYGYVFVPGIKAGYRLHKNITALLSFEYSFGPEQEFPDMEYKPAGTPSASGYNYTQMTTGNTVIVNRESKLSAAMINLTVAFTLPK